MKISGAFDVKLNPLDGYTTGIDGVALGRMSIDKTYYGDLSATGQGEMLSAMTAVKGSAGYVAIEQVSGNLSGRKGSFVVQHFATMAHGNESQTLEIVPDSGTGDLVGLSGTMQIVVDDDGQHGYVLEYELPD